MEEEYRGKSACESLGADLADAFHAVSRPSFGCPKATRATLTNGLRIRLGMTGGAERKQWLDENREFVSSLEVFIEEEDRWETRWENGRWL